MRRRPESGMRPGALTEQGPLDPWTLRSLENNDSSELSWGDGLVPPGYEDASPIEGGMYRGKSPAQPERVKVSRGL